MKVPFYTSTREYTNRKAKFDSTIQAVLERGDFILGTEVKELEAEIEKYSRVKHAVGVANGSDALVLASDILGYKDGAEVITPVFTFFASSSCIARLGGKPVFCDVNPDTFNMDMDDAAGRITKKTRGLLPVHLFLQMADMNTCMKLASDYNLTVLEDAAEAFGMEQSYKENYISAGTVGDMGIYSFFPTKTLGGYGDGGMIITNNEGHYRKAVSLRVHGSNVKYHHDYVGYNSRLDTLQAAILRVKLDSINESITRREKLGKMYRERLSGLDQVKLPLIKAGNKPVYYVFTIKAENRDGLNDFLKQNGIGTSIYYPVPLHLQKCFNYLGYKKGDFPVAEKLCTEVLALPMYPELTETELEYICEKIKEFFSKQPGRT